MTPAYRVKYRSAWVNARLIDPASGRDEPGGVYVVDGRIADLGPRLFQDGVPDGVEITDCRGLVLAPGLVDLRAALCEPGFEHKETIATASRSAAAGGITSLVALPDTDPVVDDVAGLEFVARRAREVREVKIFPTAAVTRGLAGRDLTDFGLLAEAGAVAFTDATRPVSDALVLRRALAYAGAHGCLIVQHPEEPRLAEGGDMNEGAIATRLGLAGIPAAAEAMQLERDVRLVALTGGRYHAAHVSTAEGVEVIRQAKARGLRVTCDTAPPYFALTEAEVGEYRTFAKLSPPLRSEADRRAVIAGLADGTIDAIASDHRPEDRDSKRLPFAQAAPGAVGFETLLPVGLELVHQEALELAALLRLLTCGPAGIVGLVAGRLEVGRMADLVLIDPDLPWTIERERLLSKSKNTPFDKRAVRGRAVRTIIDGRTVHALSQRAEAAA